MIKFSGEQDYCQKCGYSALAILWVDHDKQEYLKITCKTCDFSWKALPVDTVD